MKVAHIVSTFPPYRAGIGNSAYHMSWELARLGAEVTVFTATARGGSDVDRSWPFAVKRMRPWLYYGNAAFVPQLLWQLSSFDIVHLHYPFFGGAEMLYFLDKLRPLNLVLHYHMDVVGEGIFKRVFQWHSNHVLPHIVKHAKTIIVTTLDYARQSNIRTALEHDSQKFIEIPLGVNPEIFKPRIKNKDLVESYGLANKKIILFVGGLDRAHYFKGVNYLIKAFHLISSNDEYRLVVVGDGALRPSYETLVSNFGLERKVIFAGAVSDDQLPLYYNMADVYVLPSIDSSEAFGLTVVEAMSSGLPVIASDLPGVRSVIKKNTTGYLFKPKDIGTLAKHMHYLLENPQVRNHLGGAARKRVLDRYAWSIIGAQLMDLYEQRLA